MNGRYPSPNEIIRLALPAEHLLCYYIGDSKRVEMRPRDRLHRVKRVVDYFDGSPMVRLESLDRTRTVMLSAALIVRLTPLELLALQAEGSPGKYIP